jgi:hypothetical protein
LEGERERERKREREKEREREREREQQYTVMPPTMTTMMTKQCDAVIEF